MGSLTAKKKRAPIQHSDPGKILALIQSLREDKCSMLQEKLNRYFQDECEADLSLHIVIHTEHLEAYIETVGECTLSRKKKIMMTPMLTEIMKTNLSESELLTEMGSDYQDIVTPFVPQDPIDPGAKKRIMFMPITDKPFSIIVCIVAPKTLLENVAFVVEEGYAFFWPILKKSIALEFERTMKQKCQQLLKVSKKMFTQVSSLDNVLQIAMEQAKLLIGAEACSVKMVDVDRMQFVENAPLGKGDSAEEGELRFPLNKGIAGHVLNTGQLVNCRAARQHEAFDPTIDCPPGMKCKTLLCFPIRDQSGIIGVATLINKVQDPYFDAMDEEMALAFSMYSGVSIMHSMIYKKLQEALTRNALANELVIYHMKVSEQEVSRVLDCTGFHGHPNLTSLHFNIKVLPIRELPCYALKFFKDLGFIDKFHLKPEKLARFVLHVKKGYRDVPYHNWFHAFSVAQAAYAAMISFNLITEGYLSDLQALMYLVAGLCHDLDHRGTTNSFQLQGQTSLSALYSSEGSVMERHHLAQAMCILNTEGCDILESLPRRDYDRAIFLLKDYIIASDLANYFKNKEEYMIISKDYQKGQRFHTNGLMALLMNAADLSDQLKDWGSVKKTAAAVLTEFFNQGDQEKSLGGLPDIIMDREKCFIPDLQIQFLTDTCLPLFEMLSNIIPRANPCLKVLENHIERWDGARSIFQEVPIAEGLTVLLSPELDRLIELNIQEKERLDREAEEEAAAAAAAAAEKQQQKEEEDD